MDRLHNSHITTNILYKNLKCIQTKILLSVDSENNSLHLPTWVVSALIVNKPIFLQAILAFKELNNKKPTSLTNKPYLINCQFCIADKSYYERCTNVIQCRSSVLNNKPKAKLKNCLLMYHNFENYCFSFIHVTLKKK